MYVEVTNKEEIQKCKEQIGKWEKKVLQIVGYLYWVIYIFLFYIRRNSHEEPQLNVMTC